MAQLVPCFCLSTSKRVLSSTLNFKSHSCVFQFQLLNESKQLETLRKGTMHEVFSMRFPH